MGTEYIFRLFCLGHPTAVDAAEAGEDASASSSAEHSGGAERSAAEFLGAPSEETVSTYLAVS